MIFMSSGNGRGPTDDFWYEPTGLMTPAGVRVSSETAMQLSSVFLCVKILAETLGHLPLHLHRRLPNGGAEKATKHPLYRLLYRRPNRWQTSMEWREMVQGHLAIRGNAYNRIIYQRNGQIDQLIPLHPDRMAIRLLDDQGRLQYVYEHPDGSKQTFHQDEILHLRGLSSDGYYGLNPIEVQRQSVGYAQAAQEYGARFYANGATMPGWIEHEGQFKDNDQRRKFRESWQEQQTGSNKFKTPVLEFGMKYHQLDIKHTDLEYLSTVKHKDLDIARIFRMPPVKLGIEVKGTYSNREQDSLNFVIDTLMPWLQRWEQRLEESLLLDSEQGEYFFKFNVDALLRGDSKARAEYYHYAITDGWMTRNEARHSEDMNPKDGLDKPLQPLNMEPVGGRRDQQARAALVMERAADRVVRKEVGAIRRQVDKFNAGALHWKAFAAWSKEFFEEHVGFVVSALAVGEEEARLYCRSSCADLRGAIADEVDSKEPCISQLLQQWEATKAGELMQLGEE